MEMGKCYQCHKSIMNRSANGVYRVSKDFAQVCVEVCYPDRAAKTMLHVPVCKTCADNIDSDAIQAGVNTDKNYLEFKALNPDTTFGQITREV